MLREARLPVLGQGGAAQEHGEQAPEGQEQRPCGRGRTARSDRPPWPPAPDRPPGVRAGSTDRARGGRARRRAWAGAASGTRDISASGTRRRASTSRARQVLDGEEDHARPAPARGRRSRRRAGRSSRAPDRRAARTGPRRRPRRPAPEPPRARGDGMGSLISGPPPRGAAARSCSSRTQWTTFQRSSGAICAGVGGHDARAAGDDVEDLPVRHGEQARAGVGGRIGELGDQRPVARPRRAVADGAEGLVDGLAAGEHRGAWAERAVELAAGAHGVLGGGGVVERQRAAAGDGAGAPGAAASGRRGSPGWARRRRRGPSAPCPA